MTREDYLIQLKNNIQSLTIDEQNEALQYYIDYFEEAADDEKVINELGTPEEVAASIIEKFANALVETEKSKKSNTEDDKSDEKDEKSTNRTIGALYYKFNESEVKNLEFRFGVSEVVLIPGDCYSVETRGILKENFMCRIDSDSTLVVKNLKKLNGLNFWNHEYVTRIVPRILITIPRVAKVNKCKIVVDAGNFKTKDVLIECESGKIEVGAGNIVLKNIHGKNVNFRCGMGNIKMEGVLQGRSDIDCGMGLIKLDLQGNQSDYSYDAKIGLGDFKFNDEKRSGVCQNYAEDRKENHFSVNCGMGSVNISLHSF